ncbi:hypothetical protein SAMN05443634_107272 [Chishuiella changwenlii]|uniref:Secreted protein n=1 Tax=Chishuiella changwenlii TaxID=1434701 RepID=A0A1M6ZDZ9_9FLAO|nr:hypothetical protein [Chishuiella changwenlii]GGE86329.1 hypothetical protein GCM10010984_00210 [Chishuiella changwenlii]SHL28573.1 hypothetical protein SAMN05443634_107272 [Chishuiella changwenlii]
MKKILLLTTLLLSTFGFSKENFNTSILDFHQKLNLNYSSIIIIEEVNNDETRCGIEQIWEEYCYTVHITYSFIENGTEGSCRRVEIRTPNGNCTGGAAVPPPTITNCDYNADGTGPVICTTVSGPMPEDPGECHWDLDLEMEICP